MQLVRFEQTSFLESFDSRGKEKEDVNVELEITDLQSSIYVDTAFAFKKNNKDLPKENKYHSFLLNTEGKVILIGSPIANKKIMDIYKSTVNI